MAPIRFHVYSEGEEATFDETFGPYAKWATKNNVAMAFHLNGNMRNAFHAMVRTTCAYLKVLVCLPHALVK